MSGMRSLIGISCSIFVITTAFNWHSVSSYGSDNMTSNGGNSTILDVKLSCLVSRSCSVQLNFISMTKPHSLLNRLLNLQASGLRPCGSIISLIISQLISLRQCHVTDKACPLPPFAHRHRDHESRTTRLEHKISPPETNSKKTHNSTSL